MRNYSLQKGFTLAEILIALGIIGVVAAMTIPTLISSIQEANFHAKWKECYAVLNNAFKMVVAENPRMVVAPAHDSPYGDTGTKTETSGHQGCDENIQGSEIGNGVALYEAAGAGCSYKYLHEK